MRQLIKIMMAVCLVTLATTFAQDKDYSSEPGYVDFGDLSGFEDGQGVTEIYIEDNLLKMVARLAEKEDPDVAAMIGGLKLIKVNTYEVTDNNKKSIAARMESIHKKLDGKHWQRIVRTRSDDDNAYIYVKADGSDKFIGLVVLAMGDDGEAAFVNIVGDIDIATIGSLSDKFDIPALDGIKKDSKTKASE